jgi:hypothetical protein
MDQISMICAASGSVMGETAMDGPEPNFEHDASVAVLAVVVGLAAQRRPLTAEAVLRDASRRLMSLKGPAISRDAVKKHVQAAMERFNIEKYTPFESEADGLLRYWA